MRPSWARFSAQEISSWRAMSRSNRSCTTALGICSSIVAAGVPGRIEYWKEKAEENRDSRTTRNVSSKSASVSPGKPTMMSVVIAASGIAARTRSMIPRKRSAR